MHITAGIAGVTHNDEWITPSPPWVRFQERTKYGYARFDVLNRTHIRGSAVDARNDSTFDEFWLVQPPL